MSGVARLGYLICIAAAQFGGAPSPSYASEPEFYQRSDCKRTPFSKDPFHNPNRKGSAIAAKQCQDNFLPGLISAAVYEGKGQRLTSYLKKRGIDRVSDWSSLADGLPESNQREIAEKAKKSGFGMGVFEDDDTNIVYVAFEGTGANWNDIKTDLVRGLGGDPAQYALAEKMAFLAKKRYRPPKKIVFVGHSLGGGLAMRAARTVKAEAVVFNSDGVGKSEYKEFYANGSDAKITNIYATGDPLHMPQDWDTKKIGSRKVGVVGTVVNAVKSANNISKDALIQPGELVYIPNHDQCEKQKYSGGLWNRTKTAVINSKAGMAGDQHRMTTVLRNLDHCIQDGIKAGLIGDDQVETDASVLSVEKAAPDASGVANDEASGSHASSPVSGAGSTVPSNGSGERQKAAKIQWDCQLNVKCN